MPPPPPAFTAIQTATGSGTIVNFIGAVVSAKEPRKTRGTDWVWEFTIQDDFTAGMVGGGSTINCRLFEPTTDRFPKITGPGDIAILRNVKLNSWRDRLDCVKDGRANSGALVFPAGRIPGPELSQAYQLGNQQLPYNASFGMRDPTAQEQMAVINMKHAASGVVGQVQQHAATVSFAAQAPEKLCLIKDLGLNAFYDIRAQVVNVYYTIHGTVELKVTDYTPNTSMFYYADPEQDTAYMVTQTGWKGPYGYLVLSVILHESNAAWARLNVSTGDFVFLKNMHAKLSPSNKLEGAVHQDRQHPDQVDIRKLISQSDIDEITKRKDAYENQRGNKSAFEAMQNEPKKSSAKASAAKKEKKRQKLREQNEAEQKELEDKARGWEAERSGVNTNIRAAFPEMKLSTLSDIVYNPHLTVRTPKFNDYKLPFVNTRHRARVRVVDFYPPELELFAHSTSDPQWNRRPKKQDSNNGHTKERWEWGFVLLLEDANVRSDTVSEKLRVVVGNVVGQGLLNQNAVDLRKNPHVLKQLEEKLFILWGNLLELKTELRMRGSDLPLPPGDNRVQNKPFDCCIEEYGHEVSIVDSNPEGYQRMHQLAQTFITT